MDIDVNKAIKELIFEHPAVIIPGLGGITSTPAAATVDYVQSVVTPPGKKLDFNANLTINDGVLVGHIQQANLVTTQQAKEAVDAFVEGINSALDRREIVEIPQVGRLYRDYEKRLKFMAEGSNFEASSFGLPNVQFTPVIRERPAATTPPPSRPSANVAAANTPATATPAASVASASAEASPAAPPVNNNDLLSKIWPSLVLLAAVLLALSIYMLFRGGNGERPATAETQQERTNVKPGSEADPADVTKLTPPATPTDEDAAKTEPATTAPKPIVPPRDNHLPPVISDSKTTSFIVVHSFGNPANATKFERTLNRGGYEPTTKEEGALKRVGILFEHETQMELDSMIAKLGKLFKASPKVVEY